jgi:hypothetical protein
VVSTHQKPTDCLAPFIRADEGYEGPHASNAYERNCRPAPTLLPENGYLLCSVW